MKNVVKSIIITTNKDGNDKMRKLNILRPKT